MRMSRWLRGISAALAVVCVMGLSGAMMPVYADEQSDLAEQLTQAQKELNEQKKKLEEAKKNSQNAKKLSNQLRSNEKALREQIAVLVGQISDKELEIAAKQDEIDVKQNEIDAKQADIDTRWGNFKERVAAMQAMREGGTIAMLAQVQNLTGLLTFADNLQQISRYDNQVLDEMAAEKARLEAMQTELEIQKTEMEIAREEMQGQMDELEETKAALAKQIQRQDAEVNEAAANEAAAKEEYQAKYEIWKAAQEEYEKMVINNPGSAVVGDGSMIWPLPGYTRLSSYFGENREIFPGIWSNNHGGVDIPAPAGTPIIAAQTGTVYNSYYSASYGNVVMVDHGDGRCSIYAHMTSRAVSSGQVVVVGQVLGYVGSTGQSNGNHLHFEVRLNGQRVNPLNYATPA